MNQQDNQQPISITVDMKKYRIRIHKNTAGLAHRIGVMYHRCILMKK